MECSTNFSLSSSSSTRGGKLPASGDSSFSTSPSSLLEKKAVRAASDVFSKNEEPFNSSSSLNIDSLNVSLNATDSSSKKRLNIRARGIIPFQHRSSSTHSLPLGQRTRKKTSIPKRDAQFNELLSGNASPGRLEQLIKEEGFLPTAKDLQKAVEGKKEELAHQLIDLTTEEGVSSLAKSLTIGYLSSIICDGPIEISKKLAERGADFSQLDPEGECVLHYVLDTQGELGSEKLTFLLDEIGIPLPPSLLHTSLENNASSTLVELLERGMLTSETINKRNGDETPFLHSYVKCAINWQFNTKVKNDVADHIAYFVSLQVDIDAIDDDGNTVFDLAKNTQPLLQILKRAKLWAHAIEKR